MSGRTFAIMLLLLLWTVHVNAQSTAIRPPVQALPPAEWPAFPASQYPALAQTLLKPKLNRVVGRVVRFNAFVMPRTSQGDIFVQRAYNDSFLRLVYCPFDCGFDAPSASKSQMLPQRMTETANHTWTFGVYAPRTDWEKTSCASIAHALKEVKPHKYVFIDDESLYAPLSGAEKVHMPALNTLPCLVIGDWTDEGRPAQ